MVLPAQPEFVLSPQQLVQLFPFHLALDSSLIITQVGQVLARIYPNSLDGQLLNQHFVLTRPKIPLTLAAIQSRSQSIFLLTSQDICLSLKGQMVFFPNDQGILFLCSPSVTNAIELSTVGIKLKDFPLHDSTPDLVFLHNTTTMSVQQVEELNIQLSESQEKLQDALKVQENLRYKAEEQAQKLEQQLQELKETQMQLVQAEKMSSLGQLISGIVHEINNPLHFIHGNLDHCMDYIEQLSQFLDIILPQLGLDRKSVDINNLNDLDFLTTTGLSAQDLESILFILEDFPQMMKSMRIGTNRVREIIHGLRSFSRLDATSLDAFDVHEGIDNTLMILKSRLTKASSVIPIDIIKYYNKIPIIRCYSGQINQVFMNIIGNAIDALEDYCEQIKSDQSNHLGASSWPNDTLYSPTIWIETDLTLNGWLRISIRDNGCGIEPAVKDRIFEPFFTTKSAHRGTGLGMSISHKIVTERHGGHLVCHSELGRGTEFVIELPIAPGPGG